MWSIRQSGPAEGLRVVSVARRAVRPLASVTREDLQNRFYQRRLPPIVMILFSLVLWGLIFVGGRAIFQLLALAGE